MKKLLAVLLSILMLTVLCTAVSFSAMAAKSPEGGLVYKISVVSYASGQPTAGTYKVEGENIRLIAAEKSNYVFTGWVIKGEYNIISGTLTSKELVIKPLSDLSIEESYDVEGSQGFGKTNDSDKAPQTGNPALGASLILLVSGISVMMYAKKRLAA